MVKHTTLQNALYTYWGYSGGQRSLLYLVM